MPITTDPTPITVLAPQTVQADQSKLQKLVYDAGREILSDGKQPAIAELWSRRFAEDKDGNRSYAEKPEMVITRDVYTTAANLAKEGLGALAQMLTLADKQVHAELYTYLAARKIEMDAAKDVEAKAQAELDAATAAEKPDADQVASLTKARDAARANALTARMAYADPANPKLVIEG
jgi:hypothetical protein